MDLSTINIYWVMITLSIIIILSYLFNFIAKKTKIPSVILLIATGFIGSIFFPIDFKILKPFLEILGAIGLIMIVLEASLDLELKKEKTSLLIKAIISSIALLVVGAVVIGFIIQWVFEVSFTSSLAYSIPLSIMSSAIIIPSVGHLGEHSREFLIYEASFSDIFGIMFFYFLIDSTKYETTGAIAANILSNIAITLVVSFILGYIVILMIQKVTAEVKLFLPIAVLILLYSIGKLFHLSSLIFILVFGLMINNRHLFFKSRLMRIFKESKFDETLEELKIITLESSFVVRTLFFIVFGMTITADGINDPLVYIVGIATLIVLFGSRFGLLSVLIKAEKLPAILVSPRGLITILLFFAIPDNLVIENFRSAILLLVILASNSVMTYGLMKFSPSGHVEPNRDYAFKAAVDDLTKPNEDAEDEANS